MKTLSIDIETFSSAPLSKCGVYKYVEAPDFVILLFGYSADGGPVKVIDLACGEKLPSEIAAALTDEAITKWAFNANFERICLSRFLGLPTGEYLEPAQWHCSMIWAATMGLPLSLEGVGAVLGLEKQKLTEGKDLIKYFCQPCTPTKSNDGRTRNYPYHAPEKWSMFKKYNGGHPVLRWMMDNIFIRTDPAGNIKPDKEKSTEKIDGAVATIMALDRAQRVGITSGTSVYDERGIITF